MLNKKRVHFKDCAVGTTFKRRNHFLTNLKKYKTNLIDVKVAKMKEKFEVMYADNKAVNNAHKKMVMECYKTKFKTDTI